MASVRTRCPVCFKSMAESVLEQHVNACLDTPTATDTPVEPPPSLIDEQVEFLRRAAERRAQEERDRQLALQMATPGAEAEQQRAEQARRQADAKQERDRLARERLFESTRTAELEQWYNQLLQLPDNEDTREQIVIVRQQLEDLSRAALARDTRLRELDEQEREALAREDAALAQRLAVQELTTTVPTMPTMPTPTPTPTPPVEPNNIYLFTQDYNSVDEHTLVPTDVYSIRQLPSTWVYANRTHHGIYSVSHKSSEYREIMATLGITHQYTWHITRVQRLQDPNRWRWVCGIAIAIVIAIVIVM